MVRRTHLHIGCIALLLVSFSLPTSAADDTAVGREIKIKAALLYNFIRFTEWPEKKIADSNTIVIGLLGDDDFMEAFDPVKDKPIKDRKLVVETLGAFSQIYKQTDKENAIAPENLNRLRRCHVLFICASEKKYTKNIIELVKGHGVLTIGETENLLEEGGIICFVPGAQKPDFEINLVAAKRERLQISSRVLRLAKRVIQEKSEE